MKKHLLLIIPAVLAAAAVFCSCEKEGDTDPFASGTCIAQARVGAGQGSLSVAVETSGMWRLSCSEEWLHFDVEGGVGKQAFTVFYESNSSDIINLKPARVAKIAIKLDSPMVADTLVLVQQGFLGGEIQTTVKPDSRIKLEFDSKAITEATFVCCSSEGLDDDTALLAWINGQGADAYVLNGTVNGTLPGGIKVAGCNFAGLSAADEYAAFRAVVDGSVNSSFDSGTEWIVAGQMYHLSSMQSAYPSTPAWYPADAKGDDFLSDRYAWQNNLYDTVWMSTRDYVSTYTDAEAHSYSTDYVYVSASVLDMISSMSVVAAPVAGMAHKAIVLNLKF